MAGTSTFGAQNVYINRKMSSCGSSCRMIKTYTDFCLGVPRMLFKRCFERTGFWFNCFTLCIQRCFYKGCPTIDRQWRLALWVMLVWDCVELEVHFVSARRKENSQINIFVLFPSFTLKQSIKQLWITISHNVSLHCHILFYTFCRTIFLKTAVCYHMYPFPHVGGTCVTF